MHRSSGVIMRRTISPPKGCPRGTHSGITKSGCIPTAVKDRAWVCPEGENLRLSLIEPKGVNVETLPLD